MDSSTVSLIGSVLLFIGSLITLFFNRRESKARTRNQDTDTLAKLEEIINKVQERADKLYDEKVACEVMTEKLRSDLAAALVDISDLKTQLANRDGYIQGITDPLVKLEQAQRHELQGAGRRTTDTNK